ncbi:MAG: hypothetical protein GXO88_01385 [Chlorobi bacterium]|nr:hypothetical protein [Chlorobiota bacterium]
MTNFFTLTEHQDLKKQKSALSKKMIFTAMPSVYSMKVIFGYGAAIKIHNSRRFGEISYLIN